MAGPCKKKTSNSNQISCNRIKVRDVASNRVGSHEFVFKTTVKDASIAEQLRQMYLNDFNETQSEKLALSVEDKKFIDLMQNEGKIVNSRYCLPLPLKQNNPSFPDNRRMATKRLNSVKNKMMKNENYCKDYKKFMGDLISRGYAQKADLLKPIPKNFEWFVPHYGVYHPVNKKFRVVIDCSATFNGVSLNQELIQGPDNNNLLQGVILRFKKHSVPFMGDLEQMFFQILVPENQRSLLRFL